jgi:hypothetical protein
MSKAFISWYDGQSHSLANDFVGLLKNQGFALEHSPCSPHSGTYDERWKNWYADGLPKAIDRAEIFIAVITPACADSTWMLQEFEVAYSKFLETRKPVLYFIRFDSIEQPVKYPEHYLASSIRLSSNLEEAVQTLINSSS